MKTIILDVDGVLLDFVGAVSPMGDQSLLAYVELEQWADPWESARARINDPGFGLTLKPYRGAFGFYQSLRDFGKVIVATSPWEESETWDYDRREALLYHFGIHPNDVVFIHTSQKHLLRGDLVIDDHAEVCASFESRGAGAVLIDRPWNWKYQATNRVDTYEAALWQVKELLK